MGFQMAMGDIGAVYPRPTVYAPGQEVELDNRLYQFKQYNDGDGNIPGLRGQICYDVVVAATNRITMHEITCDYTEGTVIASQEFAGLIMPNVVLDGEFCWVQTDGDGLTRGEFPVYTWTNAAITRTSDAPWTQRLIPHTIDGVSAVASTANESRIFSQLYADVRSPLSVGTLYYLIAIPLGQTTSAQFSIGETITANGDDGDVVEVLRRGTTDYGLILTDVTGAMLATETAVGGTSAASGVIGAVGMAVYPQNYRVHKPL